MHLNDAEFDAARSTTVQDRVVSVLRSYPLIAIIKKNISTSFSAKIEPEDVRQDLILSILRTVAPKEVFRMHGAGQLLSWLHTAARYTVSGHLRKTRARKRHDGHNTFGESENVARSGPLLDAVDGARSPSSVEAATEAKGALLTALLTLDAKYRRALTLCYLDGNSPEQVAVIMRQPKDVVRGLLYRGARMLRARMGPADQWFNEAKSEDYLWKVVGLIKDPTGNGSP